MGPALTGVDVVDVAEDRLVVAFVVFQTHFHNHTVTVALDVDGLPLDLFSEESGEQAFSFHWFYCVSPVCFRIVRTGGIDTRRHDIDEVAALVAERAVRGDLLRPVDDERRCDPSFVHPVLVLPERRV